MVRKSVESDSVELDSQKPGTDLVAKARAEAQEAMPAHTMPRDGHRLKEPTELDTSGLEALYKSPEKLSYGLEKQRFDQLLRTNPEIKETLTQNLADLEKRLAGRPDAREQTAEVLHSVNQLLGRGEQAVLKPPTKQVEVAAGILEHAAHPEAVNQGPFNSCAFASMETEVYTRNPGIAAKLVSDVAITGRFTAKDGTTVEVDKDTINRPFDTPNPVLSELSDRVGPRDQASQIFQATAFDVKLADGSKSPLHFALREPNSLSPSGEFVGAEGEFEANQIFSKIPAIREYESIYKRITGQESNGVLTLGDAANGDEFQTALAKAKAQGRMPISVAINTTSEVFKDSLTEDAATSALISGIGAHMMTITDYDPQSQTVYFRNHLNGAREEELSPGDLYNNMTYDEFDSEGMDKFVQTVTEKLKGKPFDKFDMEVTLRQMYPGQRQEIVERLSESLGVDILSQFSRHTKERLELDLE